MKKLNKYQAWTVQLVENLSSYMNLSEWNIHVDWSEKVSGTDKTDDRAFINADSTYLNANITFLKPVRLDFQKGDIDKIVRTVLHELSHILLDPFHDKMSPFLSDQSTPDFIRVLEQQTQKLTMILLKNLPKELIPPR